MKLIAHDCFERGEDFVIRTMTGVELRMGQAMLRLKLVVASAII